MLQKTAVFESGFIAFPPTENPVPVPSTPFQILSLASSNYVVRSNTMLYVPVFTFDDSPAVTGCPQPGIPGTPGCIGIWPANHKAALSYVYDAQKLHSHDFAITIDGTKTTLSTAYLAGPVSFDGTKTDGGSNMLVVAAYVAPLATGSHTVTISGVIDGPYLAITFPGFTSFPFSQAYTINVTQ